MTHTRTRSEEKTSAKIGTAQIAALYYIGYIMSEIGIPEVKPVEWMGSVNRIVQGIPNGDQGTEK